MKIPRFRAWHKELEIMARVSSIGFGSKTLGVWRSAARGEQWVWSFEEIELMQWTGLQDNRGVDIYEGDIISNDWDSGYVYCAVKWNAEEAYWYVQHLGEGTDMLYEMNEKVIGNIYENPELMEQK